MILKRTLASQMKDSFGERVNVTLKCDNATFKAVGKIIKFKGNYWHKKEFNIK